LFRVHKYFILLLLVIIVTLSAQVMAIGISPADAYVNFVPGHEYVITYSVNSYRPFDFYTQGPFSEFTRIETIKHTDTSGTFKVFLTLPEEYEEPGQHRMYVAAMERQTPGAVNTIAAIRAFVEVDVPYPGYYATMDVHANNVNVGEPVVINVNVKNKGKLNITDAKLVLDITSDGRSVKEIRSEKMYIRTGDSYDFQTVIAGDELKPGVYGIVADLSYEGKSREETANFRVGTFDVAIVNYTKEMYNNSVNLFGIEVESLWNNRIDTVWMDLTIKNGSKSLSTVKTPPFDLVPWEKRKTSFYWNTEGIPVGEYTLETILHYDEGVKTENRKIYIVEPPIEEESTKLPVSTVVLLVIALLLVGFNAYFIMTHKKRKNKEAREAGMNASDNEKKKEEKK